MVGERFGVGGEALAADALWACFLPPGSSGPPGRGGGGENGLRAAGEAAAVAPTNPIPRAARACHRVLFRSPAPPPSRPLPTQQSNYLNLGIIITVVSFTCLIISWPAWGGMFLPPKPYAVRKFKSWQRNGHVVLARLCCLPTHPMGPPVLPAPVKTRDAPPSIGAAVMSWRERGSRACPPARTVGSPFLSFQAGARHPPDPPFPQVARTLAHPLSHFSHPQILSRPRMRTTRPSGRRTSGRPACTNRPCVSRTRRPSMAAPSTAPATASPAWAPAPSPRCRWRRWVSRRRLGTTRPGLGGWTAGSRRFE